MLLKKYNIVFTPISLSNGMATSKRLHNFYIHLNDNKIYSIHNLVHEPDSIKKQIQFEHKNIEGLNYYKIKYNYKNSYRFFKFILLNFKVLKKIVDNKCINILYHSGYPNIRNILFIVYAKTLHYKVIFDIVEDNSMIRAFKSPMQYFKNKSSILFFRFLYLFTDGIVCISTTIYNKTKRITKDKIPLILIPISINENYFLETSKKPITKVGITLFYGGSFGEKDGIGYLLSAFDVLADKYDVTLIMTGKGNEHDMLVYKNRLNQLKNKNKIRYTGYLEDSKYYELLQTADIHCMVRINSDFANAGFPFKLGEMLATGKPVIVTKVSDVEKYLGSGDAFLIEPENIEEIIETIIYIINNPSIAKKVGENGKKIAHKYFSSATIFKKYINFIQNEIK